MAISVVLDESDPLVLRVVVDHVSITVDDLEAAVDFYDAVLGALGYYSAFVLDPAGVERSRP